MKEANHSFKGTFLIETDQRLSGLIRKAFIKGRGVEIFSEFRPPPSCESFLKFPSASFFIDSQFKHNSDIGQKNRCAL
jgi:hypothetical protein